MRPCSSGRYSCGLQPSPKSTRPSRGQQAHTDASTRSSTTAAPRPCCCCCPSLLLLLALLAGGRGGLGSAACRREREMRSGRSSSAST